MTENPIEIEEDDQQFLSSLPEIINQAKDGTRGLVVFIEQLLRKHNQQKKHNKLLNKMINELRGRITQAEYVMHALKTEQGEIIDERNKKVKELTQKLVTERDKRYEQFRGVRPTHSEPQPQVTATQQQVTKLECQNTLLRKVLQSRDEEIAQLKKELEVSKEQKADATRSQAAWDELARKAERAREKARARIIRDATLPSDRVSLRA